MEELIDQFKLVTEGTRPPAGEVYSGRRVARTASSASTWSATAPGNRRSAAVAPPSFSNTQPMRDMVRGALLADMVPTFDMINMIGGECDR